ncbi:MAG: LmeA family phospholipid-binding protein [Armatimonadota bacterium]
MAVRGLAVVVAGAIMAAVAIAPAAADEALLRRAFEAFLHSADELRIEAIPDLYDGGYARVTVIGRRVMLTQGLRVDEAMINLVGVSLDPEALRAGKLRVLDARDSAMQVRVLLRSLEEHFNAGTSKVMRDRLGSSSPTQDIRLWTEEGYLLGSGTVMFRGSLRRMRMKGFFAVDGTTEIYFYIETLHADGLPMPVSVIREVERRINPVVHQRDWPVTFKIRSVRLDAQGLTISSRPDAAAPGQTGGSPPTLSP